MDKQIYFGATYRCLITGFQGVAIAHTKYITGCDNVALQPRVNDKGEMQQPKWFDATRLARVEDIEIISFEVCDDPGGPQPIPDFGRNAPICPDWTR